MEIEVSCGVFLIDKETKRLLICKFRHSTWSVPKGPNLPGETYFSTATRELYEETNISYKNLAVEHTIEYEVMKDEHRKLKAFIIYVDNDVDNIKLKCHTMSPTKKKPIVEMYKWANLEEACEVLNPCQVEILKSL